MIGDKLFIKVAKNNGILFVNKTIDFMEKKFFVTKVESSDTDADKLFVSGIFEGETNTRKFIARNELLRNISKVI